MGARKRGRQQNGLRAVNRRNVGRLRLPSRLLAPCIGAKLSPTLAIDASGRDEMDKRPLRVMAENKPRGPGGMSTIAVGDHAETLLEVHEASLIQEGYLQRMSQGGTLTATGYAAVELRSAIGGEQDSLL
jgi:holliday junction DNA helicase RuvB